MHEKVQFSLKGENCQRPVTSASWLRRAYCGLVKSCCFSNEGASAEDLIDSRVVIEYFVQGVRMTLGSRCLLPGFVVFDLKAF